MRYVSVVFKYICILENILEFVCYQLAVFHNLSILCFIKTQDLILSETQ